MNGRDEKRELRAFEALIVSQVRAAQDGIGMLRIDELPQLSEEDKQALDSLVDEETKNLLRKVVAYQKEAKDEDIEAWAQRIAEDVALADD